MRAFESRGLGLNPSGAAMSYCVMVAQVTLTHLVGVQIPVTQPVLVYGGIV